MDGQVDGDLVVAAAQVLHERVASRDGAQRADRFQSAHRPQPRFESAVISFHAVVRVLLQDVPRGRGDLVDQARVDRRPVGGDLNRGRTVSQRADEECPCSRAVTAFGEQDVDDLSVLIDRAIEVVPAAGELDVGLIDKPSVAHRVPRRAGGVDELGREGLHPPVERSGVDLDAALGEQFLDVAVGQPVAQVPAHRDRDHLTVLYLAVRNLDE
jgi:hypothetical protein